MCLPFTCLLHSYSPAYIEVFFNTEFEVKSTSIISAYFAKMSIDYKKQHNYWHILEIYEHCYQHIMLLFRALSSINLTKINKKKFQQMRQLCAYIANESTQNILLDPGTKPVSLVCKRPQVQFHRNLCAVTVCTDFAMMSKNVPKHIYKV